MAATTSTTPAPTMLNPAVYAAAELMTDGAITPALLADVAAMRGLSLYVPAPVQTAAESAAAEARIAAAAAEDRARGAENARRRHAAVLEAVVRGEGVATFTDVYGNPQRLRIGRRMAEQARHALALVATTEADGARAPAEGQPDAAPQPAGAGSPPADPDAELVRLCAEALAIDAEMVTDPDARDAWTAAAREAWLDARLPRFTALLDMIERTPARALAGLRAKARVQMIRVDLAPDGAPCDPQAGIMWSLCLDLLRGEAAQAA